MDYYITKQKAEKRAKMISNIISLLILIMMFSFSVLQLIK